MVIEEWRSIRGYEGLYEVSDLGRVRSMPREVIYRSRWGTVSTKRVRERILKPSLMKRGGYPAVQLSKDGIETHFKVHHLVLETFVGDRPPGDFEARHLNDAPTDNRAVNLRWGTKSENMRDAVRNGGHFNAAKTHCKWGHEFTPDNIYRQSSSGRGCRECKGARKAA